MDEENYRKAMQGAMVKSFYQHAPILNVKVNSYDRQRVNSKGEIVDYIQTQRLSAIPVSLCETGEPVRGITDSSLAKLIDTLVIDKNQATAIKETMGLEYLTIKRPSDIGQTAPKRIKKDNRDIIDRAYDNTHNIIWDEYLGRVWAYDKAPVELNENKGVIKRDDLDNYGNPLQ